MRYPGVIFDLDGVICHTDKYHYQAWKKLAERLNIPFSEEINNRLRGVSRMESLDIILEKQQDAFSNSEKIQLADEKNTLYRNLLKQMSPEDLSPVVRDTLQRLKNAGIKIAIGSSSRNAGFILNKIGLDGFFDAISDGTNIVHSKPDPEVFLIAADYLQLKPYECLVVEDAESGVLAAGAGGFPCAAIGDAAAHSDAEYKLASFSDLITIVLDEP